MEEDTKAIDRDSTGHYGSDSSYTSHDNLKALGDGSENSKSLSDDEFKFKLDDLGVEIVKDRDDSTMTIRERLKGKQNITNHDLATSDDEKVGKQFLESDYGYSLRKIPKSKTFESGMVPYFGKLDADNKQSSCEQYREFNSLNRTPIAQTHVFMTSQECVVVPGCKLPRETIASRLRFEKQHLSHDKTCGYDDYLTPLQRKDKLIKDLKRQLRELTICIDDKDKEIDMYKQHVNEETSKLVQSKDEEISKLREELTKLRQSYEDISSFCEESVSAASRMQQEAEELKMELTDKEAEHQKLYLEMYRKGQESARFEREEELERLASAGGCKVTISELVKKLAWTEVELAKWQTLRRQESYNNAQRPDTEAETTLIFLKDCFFHYLLDDKESDNHLRAMIKIMNYSEKQIGKIKASKMIQKIEKKKRSMSATVPPNY